MQIKMAARLGEKEWIVKLQTCEETLFISKDEGSRPSGTMYSMGSYVPEYLSRDKRMHEGLASAHS